MGAQVGARRSCGNLMVRPLRYVTRYVTAPLVLAMAGAVAFPALAQQSAALDPSAFRQCVANLRSKAASEGISASVIGRAFDRIQPNPRVIELDRKQPEFMQTFWQYLDARVTDTRIQRGREMLSVHGSLLRDVEQRYGVQARYLVAFWALESNFGDYTGDMDVIESLTTLACDQRRSRYFESELMHALSIADEGSVSVEMMEGSWAGAMGQSQFMPSTFVRYAVDFDGDGRRDLWRSLPDVFASSANFLRSLGWRPGEEWGEEVILPAGFDYALADGSTDRTLIEWNRLGVRRANGDRLPESQYAGPILMPAGYRAPAFLLYPNFKIIKRWNNSNLYAIAVGHLADRIVGRGPFVKPRPPGEEPLRREEVEEIQRRLAMLGFDAGEPDGIVGPMTRAAARDFQRSVGMPADGYPNLDLLERLRRASRS